MFAHRHLWWPMYRAGSAFATQALRGELCTSGALQYWYCAHKRLFGSWALSWVGGLKVGQLDILNTWGGCMILHA